MAEILDFKQLENSKIYVHPKSETLKFKHTLDYLEPFLQKFEGIQGVEWMFQADDKTVNEEKVDVLTSELNADAPVKQNISYGSVIAKAKLPESFNVIPDISSNFKDMFSEIGLVYTLSSLKPEMRLYRGKRVDFCSNGAIFGANNIKTVQLTGSYQDVYKETEGYIEESMNDVLKYKRVAEYLWDVNLNKNQIYELAGELLFFAKKNKEFGINPVSDAVNSLMDATSLYGIRDDKTSMWNVYNAVTESLKKSTILTESTKLNLLQKVFIKDLSIMN